MGQTRASNALASDLFRMIQEMPPVSVELTGEDIGYLLTLIEASGAMCGLNQNHVALHGKLLGEMPELIQEVLPLSSDIIRFPDDVSNHLDLDNPSTLHHSPDTDTERWAG